MGLPKWLQKEDSTRKRSHKQESKIAKDLKGYTTINSGATFGQNDVITDFAEVEAKTTKNKSYTLKEEEFLKLERKCKVGKLPMFIVDFESTGKTLAVLNYEDLKYLIKKANE